MSTPGHNQIRSIVERIENLETEKAEIAEGIREIYTEAKSNGFDPAVLRRVVRMRRQDAGKRAEQQAILDVYMHALGMLADTPLGQAAIEREGLARG